MLVQTEALIAAITQNMMMKKGLSLTSLSCSKLQGNEIGDEKSAVSEVIGNRITDIDSSCSMILALCCLNCKQGALSLEE